MNSNTWFYKNGRIWSKEELDAAEQQMDEAAFRKKYFGEWPEREVSLTDASDDEC